MQNERGFIPEEHAVFSSPQALLERSFGYVQDRTVTVDQLRQLHLDGMPILQMAAQFNLAESDLRTMIFQEEPDYTLSEPYETDSSSESGEEWFECTVKNSERVIRYEPEMASILHNLIYNWNMKLHEVVRETGWDSTAVWTMLQDMEERGLFAFEHRGQWEEFLEVNTDFLDRPSDYRSYFYGLMVTDGWVTSQVQNTNTGNVSYLAGIRMTNEAAEEDMLQRLGNELGIPLRYDKDGSIVLASRQQAFCKRVMEQGIEQKKSLRTRIPNCISERDHLPFLLGAIDGDGGPYLQSNVVHFPIAFKLCGATREFMVEMAERNHRLLGLDHVNVHSEVRHKKTRKGDDYATIYTIQYNYADTVQLYRKMEAAGLLPLGIQNKMPKVKTYIRSQKDIRDIPRLPGNAETKVRAILLKAHPADYLHRIGATPLR